MKMKIRNKTAFTDGVSFLEKENAQISYEAALEGIVLLENKGVLPVSTGKIALYGAGASKTIKGGTGSGEVNERHAVSILEGLEEAGFTVTTKNWIRRYEQNYRIGEEKYAAEFRKRLLRLDIVNMMGTPYQHPFGEPVTIEDIITSGTDTCIYVIARQAGESADRKLEKHEYSLSYEEKTNLALCAANYEKLIVVINVGSVFDMSFLDEIEGIGAVVYYAQQGMKGGNAFADLISGKVTPSGKTSDTWPMKYEDIPYAMEYSYLNGNVEQEYYREGIYIGYRYFDSYDVAPRYPFGYGLSYTQFSVDTQSVENSEGRITVTVKVKNTGEVYPGREVVQIYVSCPQNRTPREYQKLAAFVKTKELNPGESENVLLTFDMKDLAFYREEDAVFVLEQGNYILRVGNSSRNTSVAAVLVLEEDVVTEKCTNICRTGEKISEIKPPVLPDTEEVKNNEQRLVFISAGDFKTVIHKYKEPEVYHSPVTDAVLNVLTAEEMCNVVAGAGISGKGPRFFEAPGSAGYTTGKLIDKGLPNICLADGPAGLRLQKISTVTRRGKVKAVEPMISALKYIPEPLKKVFFGNPQKQPCVYQFATSFPTGVSLAQSWNTKLIEKVGTAVGKEMERYGITYWLAPGMNIHRNPLCGRNFEYYSEDPLLTGKIAAAMSRGVQSRRGCFVTVKHFCCNNQEDNRNHMNVNISERVLREIYLRGFQIAVREGHAKAVMSSYNKVNGCYVNNSYDLLTKVLRNEWGFDGLVMTDWFATGKNVGSHCRAILAGNDLIMPGGAGVIRELRKKVRKGEIDKKSLERCAANVIRGITGSRIYQAYRRMYQKEQR